LQIFIDESDPIFKITVPHLRKAPEPYLTYLLGIQALFFGVTPVLFSWVWGEVCFLGVGVGD
jgi:hypothetical protein